MLFTLDTVYIITTQKKGAPPHGPNLLHRADN